MRTTLMLAIVAACGGIESPPPTTIDVHREIAPRLPRTPGVHSPSLVAIADAPRHPGDVSAGTQLSDVDSCATCHPDAAAQWATSAHSFASFGNPLYRVNVELARTELGKDASQHCGGCHDMPLMVDGLMTGTAPIEATDLRAHSGVTCALCHGVKSVTKDGNGSYVWSREPIDAPVIGDAASSSAKPSRAGQR